MKKYTCLLLTVACLLLSISARAEYYEETLTGTNEIIVTTTSGSKIRIGDTEYDGFGKITIDGGITTFIFNTSANVICNDQIKVINGGTLNLYLGAQYGTHDKTLCRSADNNNNYLINMDSGSALNINGTESRSFIIHGRGSFTATGSNEGGWEASLNTDNIMIASTSALIRLHSGNIIFNYVTLRSNYNDDKQGGAIQINGSNKTVVEMNHCSINNTYSKTVGAAIFVDNTNADSKLTMNDCTVSDCFCYADQIGQGGSLRMQVNNKCQIFLDHCYFKSNKSKRSGGAVFCASPFIDLNIKDCTFEGNYAYNNGGAIYTVTHNIINGETTFMNNYSNSCGGALAFTTYSSQTLTLSSDEFKPNSCGLSLGSGVKFKDNTACDKGGAVYLKLSPMNITTTPGKEYTVFTDSKGEQMSMGVEITGATIQSNHANCGGGIAIERNTDIYLGDLKLNYGLITGNDAIENGGAIFIQSTNAGKVYGSSPWPESDMNLNFGTSSASNIINVKNNSADNGGGVYVTGSGHTTTLRNCQIGGTPTDANIATSNGGGFYINGGDIVMENGIVKSNIATKNGGGAYISGGDVVVRNGSLTSNISENGGGLYANGGNFTFENGSFAENTATNNGGGAYVNGGIVTFNNGTLKSNTAMNGGGIYLASGASMTFTDGLIAKNHALKNGNDITTAYNAKSSVPNVNGCGGGIYLQSGASVDKKSALTINVVNNFGLYGNTADRAGDDIVAEGVNTSVTVPNVTSMDLKDFEGKDAQPNWYEDYVYVEGGSDSGYSGHSILKYPGGSGKRFQQMLGSTDIDNHLVLFEESQKQYNDYVCLSLGYIVLTAKIQVTGLHETGLHEKENMYFVVEQYAKNTSGAFEFVKQYPVLIKGMGNATEERTVRNLMPGYYTVKQMQTGATPWAWAYTIESPEGGVYDKKPLFEDGVNNVFQFIVNHVENDRNVMHDEEIKINKMIEKK